MAKGEGRRAKGEGRVENKRAYVEYQQGRFKKKKILFVVYPVHHFLAPRPSLNSLSQINPRPLALHGTVIGNDPIV
jgi:hypothetical protein